MIKCGKFSFNPATQQIEGPGDYMNEQGGALVDRIVAGDDAIFNMTAHMSPSAEMAVLVRLQTDYAGWCGMQQMHAMIEQSKQAPNRPCPRRCRCESCKVQAAGMFAADLVEVQPEMF